MKSEIKIKNEAGVAIIDIEGVIGVPEKMQFDNPGERVATYEKFTEALERIRAIEAAEVIVNIRSTGGDVNDAILIYEALSELDARIVTRCLGYAASAATIIAQAASNGCREISANTLYLIHCSESAAEGNFRSLSQATSMLEATDLRIASIYARRSGRSDEEYAALMNENGGKGRWLSAEEALEAGLVDAIIPSGGAYAAKAVNFRELDSIIEMLGLPELPRNGVAGYSNEEKRRIRRRLTVMWGRMLRTLGVGSVAKQPRKTAAHKKAQPTAQNSVPVVGMMTAQDSAQPTRVQAAEDPSHTEYSRTDNEKAYDSDLQNIITR